MKRIIFLLFLLIPVISNAKEEAPKDTTIYVNSRKVVIKEREGKVRVKLYEQSHEGGMTESEQIFEGVYMDGRSTEQRFSVTLPFTKKSKRGYHRNHNPHVNGFYIGYAGFGDKLLSRADKPDLVASKSWEWGLNLFEGAFPLTPDNNWALTSGLGIGYTSFRLDDNYAFRKSGNMTIILPPSEGEKDYSQSRLRYYHSRIPVSIEWQRYSEHRGPIFLSFGGEAEVRWGAKSKVKYGDKHERTLDKNLNVNPVGINLLAKAGYGSWGFHVRYAATSLFEDNKGPKLYPFSTGVCWYW